MPIEKKVARAEVGIATLGKKWHGHFVSGTGIKWAFAFVFFAHKIVYLGPKFPKFLPKPFRRDELPFFGSEGEQFFRRMRGLLSRLGPVISK